jgi:hypothetical protein
MKCDLRLRRGCSRLLGALSAVLLVAAFCPAWAQDLPGTQEEALAFEKADRMPANPF